MSENLAQQLEGQHLSDISIPVFKERLAALDITEVTREGVDQVLHSLGKTDLHVWLTPDGNRRFEGLLGGDREKGWGHLQGANVIEEVFLPLVAQISAIRRVSLYLLSHPNLNRSEAELQRLQALFRNKHPNLIRLATEHDMRYLAAGNLEELEAHLPDMARGIRSLAEQTAEHQGLQVNLCVNYDACTELAHALKQLANKGEDATPERIQQHAWIPDPIHLSIRTGGVHRISGAPINQVWNPDTQLAVLDKLLPQTDDQDFLFALLWYAFSEQRKGK